MRSSLEKLTIAQFKDRISLPVLGKTMRKYYGRIGPYEIGSIEIGLIVDT